ncbi:DUF2807 domain-containing protein [Ralstonia pickettii]|jgi:hypothetical protein|nr:DUF2807 domain-containing protein [Ralstonia insidiosa]MBA9884389.1 DUF2807 domain-containing protein [Ralstonia pickettii]MBA9894123.1 DUF2807 domain-containing protein [Ralstonia pickettii]MBA9913663.1 DUF2807 domain-containing protein [Ralstonia insidiosa]MBA9926177.1 DUF2807 domain-containing protein [Ralstonia pickettii]
MGQASNMKQRSLKTYFAVAMVVALFGCSKSGEPDNVTVSASNGGTAIAVNNGTIVTGTGSSTSGPTTAVATTDADEIVQSSTGAGSANVVVTGGTTSMIVSGNGNAVVQSSSGRNSSNVVIVNGQALTDGKVLKAAGPDGTDVRKVELFDSLELAVPADATYSPGAVPSITISGPQNILPLIETKVRGGKLTIGIEGAVSMRKPLKVQVVAPDLRAVRIVGSGAMKLDDFQGKSLDLNILGSGTVVAAGKANSVSVTVSGSGDVDVRALQAKDFSGVISGSGNVRAYASDAARVTMSGSGDIRVAGNPMRRSVERSGSGQVEFD